jgi:hypothetical protein
LAAFFFFSKSATPWIHSFNTPGDINTREESTSEIESDSINSFLSVLVTIKVTQNAEEEKTIDWLQTFREMTIEVHDKGTK